ncbi:MAG: aminotransferase class I/II-fold pyridoxal phosphate-dependent enzyme [Myxococcales bacterium]|nr:aminotransferase class I/II-fold pyridoxal phosphate-dependent enzyme [Myxococcales bacterium]
MTFSEAQIYLSPPHVGEEERRLLLDAFASNWIAPLGPHVDAFEAEICARLGDQFCAVALSSGTAALHLALLVLGVRSTDEVVVSTLTFAATANAVRYVGATPVFVDSLESTWTMDPDLLLEALESRKRLGRRVAAVITVDLYGQCSDYDRIREVCAEFDVPIVEDAAEALGATYREQPAGTLGDLGVFSFNGNKIITTSGGGMLVSKNKLWIERARHLATQAREPARHYQHSEVGYNYRLSNLLAGVGRAQLARLESRVDKRRENFSAYQRKLGGLPGWTFMPEAKYGRSTRWLTCATVDGGAFGASRDDVCDWLAEHNIEARPVWKPMHLQPAFERFPFIGTNVSTKLFESGLCLPSGSSLSDTDRDRVVDAVLTTPGAAGTR